MKQILPIRKAVGIIISYKNIPGNILLVKKIKREDIGNGKMESSEWDIPKGGIKKGETESQALLRELKEELGSQNFKSIQRTPFKINFTFPPKLRTKYYCQETILFYAEYSGNPKNLKPRSNEIKEIKPTPIKKALELIKFKETATAIKKYMH